MEREACTHVSGRYPRSSEEGVDLLKLNLLESEIQAVVSHLIWMLGTDLESFARAGIAANHRASSPALVTLFSFFLFTF